MFKRRSFLKAVVLGTAVAFPKLSVAVEPGGGWEADHPPSLSDLVAETLRKRAPALADNITSENTLFDRLRSNALV